MREEDRGFSPDFPEPAKTGNVNPLVLGGKNCSENPSSEDCFNEYRLVDTGGDISI
ncbi:MAG: hypothetical protein CM15mP49_31980 [Actinomycetota bacterium]|nr:MAG: hypothetical protein CM15mP49_31980 [Actinomycetota bacterium]